MRLIRKAFGKISKRQKKIEYIIKKTYYNRKFKDTNTKDVLMNPSDITKELIFHDENWIRVIHRKEHRKIVSQDQHLDIEDNMQEISDEVFLKEDGSIYIDVKTETKDEWAYLYLDSEKYNWKNISWQFNVCRDTDFRELQFGFRYVDFYNRYRFRFERNKIYFDKVYKGIFLNSISSVDFPMEIGAWYNIRIDVFENNFKCYVDGKLKMSEYDFDNTFTEGSIAMIFWEDNDRCDIECKIGPINVYSLE